MKHIRTIWLLLLILLTAAVTLLTPAIAARAELFSDNSAQPDQPILFLRTYSNWAWGETHRAQLFTTDGRMLSATEAYFDPETGEVRTDWAERLLALAEGGGAGTAIPAADLRVMYSFVNAGGRSGELADLGNYACDYGTNTLFLLQRLPSSGYETNVLCYSGDNVGCLRDREVRRFCNWMFAKGYFPLWEPFQ